MGTVGAVRAAQAIIKSYGIKEPNEIDLEAIALDRKILVNDTDIEGSVARLQVKKQFGVISVSTRIQERGRRRFAIAHELGHFELHRMKSQAHICTEKDLLDWYKKEIDENEANVFAAEMLMPTEIFRRSCPRDVPSFELIRELAAMFNTSLTATAFRYVEKGYFPCALVASVNGRVKWAVKSSDFNYRIKSIDTPIHKHSCAGASLEGEPLSTVPEAVDVDCWLDQPIEDKSYKLYENSIYMPSYDTILSLLFID